MEIINTPHGTRSIFKDGDNTTTERYTAAWIKLINLLENNKN